MHGHGSCRGDTKGMTICLSPGADDICASNQWGWRLAHVCLSDARRDLRMEKMCCACLVTASGMLHLAAAALTQTCDGCCMQICSHSWGARTSAQGRFWPTRLHDSAAAHLGGLAQQAGHGGGADRRCDAPLKEEHTKPQRAHSCHGCTCLHVVVHGCLAATLLLVLAAPLQSCRASSMTRCTFGKCSMVRACGT